MGISCGCRATATGHFGMELLVDSQLSFGDMITNISICQTCNPSSSSIIIEYDSFSGANAQFVFTSINGGVGFPDCEDGNSLNIEAEGTLTGAIGEDEYINASASLQLSLNDSTNEMCITLLIEDHIVTGCRIGGQTIEVDRC